MSADFRELDRLHRVRTFARGFASALVGCSLGCVLVGRPSVALLTVAIALVAFGVDEGPLARAYARERDRLVREIYR